MATGDSKVKSEPEEARGFYSSNYNEVINSIPLIARPFFKASFDKTMEYAEKHFAAEYMAARLDALIAQGKTLPAINSIKVPVLQLSKEFQNGASSSELMDYRQVENNVRDLRSKVMENFALAKRKEAKWYHRNFLNDGALSDTYRGSKTRFIVYLLGQQGIKSEDPSQLNETNSRLYESVSRASIDCGHYIQALQRERYEKTFARKQLKEAIKSSTDVEMTESTVSGHGSNASTMKNIGSLVEEHLRRKRQSNKDKTKSDKKRPLSVANGRGRVKKQRR